MTQVDRVLQMLQSAGEAGVTTGDFLRSYLPRFSARLWEMKKEGHSIKTEFVRTGEFRYTLQPVRPHPVVAAPTEGVDLFEVIHGPYGTRVIPQGGKL